MSRHSLTLLLRRNGADAPRPFKLLAVPVFLATVAVCNAATAQASYAPASIFLEAGAAVGTDAVTAGLVWNSPYRWSLGGVVVSLDGEVSVSRWTYPTDDGRSGLTQLAAVPNFRFRGDGGASPWFGEAGIGASVTNRLFDNGRKRFSTRFNFADHLGVGRNFGAGNVHELALRVEHFSNGGISEPNPGRTFLQLRYGYRFE